MGGHRRRPTSNARLRRPDSQVVLRQHALANDSAEQVSFAHTYSETFQDTTQFWHVSVGAGTGDAAFQWTFAVSAAGAFGYAPNCAFARSKTDPRRSRLRRHRQTPRMVRFPARICGPDCGVLKGFLEEFLRRAEIRTLLKWGHPTT